MVRAPLRWTGVHRKDQALLRMGRGLQTLESSGPLDPPLGEAVITGLTRLFSLCPEAHGAQPCIQ